MNNSDEFINLTKLDRNWLLIAFMLAIFMTSIEVTIISTAIPIIATKINSFSFESLFSVYLLMQSVSIPIYGRLADIYGRKKIFSIGIFIFIIGSFLCGLSHNIFTLVLFRAIQGIGAGSITPLTLTMIADIYSIKERTIVQGWISLIWGASAILGPLIGAYLLQYFIWSIVFWINVPIGLIILSILFSRLPRGNSVSNKLPLNLMGCIWLIICASSSLLAILKFDTLGYWIFILLLISIFSGLMLRNSEYLAKMPLFVPLIWTNKTIYLSNLGNLSIGAILMVINTFIPIWLEVIHNTKLITTSWVLVIMSLGWAVSSKVTQWLIADYSNKLVIQLGSLLLFSSNFLLVLMSVNSSLIYLKTIIFFIGLSIGMLGNAFLISSQQQTNYNNRGSCTSLNLFSRMIGCALGVGFMGTIFNYNLKSLVPDIKNPIKEMILFHNHQIFFSNQQINVLTNTIFISLHRVFIITLFFSLLNIFIAWRIPKYKLNCTTN